MITRITDDNKKNAKKNKIDIGTPKITDQDPFLDAADKETEDDGDLYEEEEQPQKKGILSKKSGVVKQDYGDAEVIVLRQHSGKVYIAAGVIIVLFLAVFGFFYLNRTHDSYAVDSNAQRTDRTAMEYLSFQGGFIKYNMDGITYEDRAGNIVWTEAFTMVDPKVVTRGEYVAITDIGNNSYALYNTSKKIGNFTTDYPITDIQVATQGLVVVVLEHEKVNYIVAFDRAGSRKYIEIKTSINKNGYPLAIAMSDDGKKLVVSYITINQGTVENSLTFYNFDDVGQNEVDRQVGYKKFTGQLFPSLEFLSNDTVCAFGDSRFVIYSMKQKPKEIINKKVKDEIKSVFYNSSYVGYVSREKHTMGTTEQTSVNMVKAAGTTKQELEKAEQNKTEQAIETTEEVSGTASANYVLKAFNLKGKQILTEDIDFNYTNIHSTENEIILLSSEQCRIIKYNGFVKFKKDFNNELVDFFPSNRNNHYVLITRDATQMIHLN